MQPLFLLHQPGLLHCYSHPAIGTQSWAEDPTWPLGAAPPRHDNRQQLSKVRVCKTLMWNGCLKCAQAVHKERAHTCSYADLMTQRLDLQLGRTTIPLAVFFPLYKFTHAPQSQLSCRSRQPLRECMGT